MTKINLFLIQQVNYLDEYIIFPRDKNYTFD